MYIREKEKKKKGATYLQYQLIESVRTPSGPRQSLVYNLGTLTLSREKWKHLANRIESLLNGEPSLFASDLEVEKLAEHYYRLIVQKRQAAEAEKEHLQTTLVKEKPHYESVDLNSVNCFDSKTIGAEHVALSQINEYGLRKLLLSLGFTDKQVNYAIMLIIARLVHPSSERETARWLQENSGLPELLGTDTTVYDTALHRVASLLWENHEAIEASLAEKAKDLFSLKETVILYDLTNTYFAGSKRNSTIAKPGGKSKEKRNDRPFITLALIVDSDGFPKTSKILKGNISEPSTCEDMLRELDEFSPLLNSAKTLVLDAGVATEENLALIRKKGFNYVVVSRKRTYNDVCWNESNEKKIPLSRPNSTLTIKSARTDTEVFLRCYSADKEAKEKAIFTKRTAKFEEGVSKLAEGLLKKTNATKNHEKVMERIGRLKEKYKVGNLYDLAVEQKDGVATKITLTKNEKGQLSQVSYGEYVLRTNRLDLDDEEVSKIHRSLTTIEASFRNMKSELGLRPNFHKTDRMTTAHIAITVIGYHVLTPILTKLRASGSSYSWNTIRDILANHVRITTAFNTENEETISLRTSTTPTQRQQEIYDALKIKHTPLKQIRTIISTRKKCSAEKNAQKIVRY